MITSIVLEWFNWSKHCEEDVSRAKTTVCRNKRRVIYEEFDGRDQTIRVQEGHFSKLSGKTRSYCSVDSFFILCNTLSLFFSKFFSICLSLCISLF